MNNVTFDEVRNVFDKYEVFISYRKSCSGGGVLVCVNKSLLPFITCIESDIEECIFILINEIVFKKPLIIAFPYIAHEGSVFYKEKFLSGIENFEINFANLNYQYDEIHWVICGDLNARTGLLDDTLINNNINEFIHDFDECEMICDTVEIPRRKTRDTESNNYGRQLVKFCKINGLFILNGRTKGDDAGTYTCIANGGRSVVDYFITGSSMYEYVLDMEVTPRPESDHFPLTLYLKCNQMCDNRLQNTETINCNDIRMLIWNENYKIVYNDILNEQLNVHLNDLLTLIPTNINDAIDKLDECVSFAAEQIQPKNKSKATQYKNGIQPNWFDEECDTLKRNKYKKLHTFHSTGQKKDLDEYLDSKRVFKNKCRLKRVMYNKTKANDIIRKFAEPNCKGFWGEIKTILNRKPIQNKVNEIQPSQWFTHFKSLLKGDLDNQIIGGEQDDTDRIIDQDQSDVLNSPILYEEVVAGLKNLKKGKAAGSDGVKAEFYQINNPILLKVIYLIMNQIFNSGIYPIKWSKCMIIPIFKKGNRDDVTNYRGISLLDILSKVFSHVLHSRLKAWCDINDLIPEEQAGFRKGYSTVDNIFSLSAIVQKYITKPKGRFYTLFVDFKVAFDSINRDKLWNVLHQNGCHGRMLKILKSMYESVMMCIRVQKTDMTHCNGSIRNENVAAGFCVTECFESMSGVKQGCLLSPMLFNLYIAELQKHFNNPHIRHVSVLTNDKETSMLMYADDLTIFADTVFEMQNKIDMLYDFCTTWGLQVNLNKTKMMVFRNGGYLKSIEKWSYGVSNIDVVTYYAYLGMIFSSRLCWSRCIEEYACRALRMVGAIRKVFNTYTNIPVHIAFKIFDIKIKPMVLYGSQIWGLGYHEPIEKVQIQFCKAYLGVGKTTPNDLALIECGRHSLTVDYNTSAVKYWTKLLHMSDLRYPRKCYLQLKAHADMGRVNWVSHIKNFLFTLGFGNIWHAQEQLRDVKLFLFDLKERLKDIDLQNLNSRITEKANIYINYSNEDFYPSTIVAPYIALNHEYSSRRIFTLLRTHSLPIKSNLLRWNISNNNLCELCNGVFVENEFHVLFRCSAYMKLRHKFLPHSFLFEPSMQKLYQLMSTQNAQIVKNVIDFIVQALKERLAV